MNFLRLLISVHGILVVFLTAHGRDSQTCITTQYILFGEEDLINCSFQEGFYGVYWYNSTNSYNAFPFIVYEDSQKSGDGYSSGKYDVYLNGSLSIRNVSLGDDHYFRVIMLYSQDDEAAVYDIRVHVIVRSKQPHPFIDVCEEESFCFTHLNKHSALSCIVNGTRPATNLTLILHNNHNGSTVPYKSIVTKDGALFSTQINTKLDFKVSNSLEVLICEVSSHLDVISVNNSKVFLENTKDDYFSQHPDIRHVQSGTVLLLNCSGSNKIFVIWKKRFSANEWDTIASIYYLEKEYYSINDPSFDMDSKGTLIVNSVEVDQEGSYLCINGNQKNEDVRIFDVQVFVLPQSPGIVVTGCEHDGRCVLHVNREGNLTCTVKGIRPKVSLKWLPFSEESAKHVSFVHSEETIAENGNTYDVTLFSQYRLEAISETKIAVECKTIGWDNTIHQLDKTVDLHYIMNGKENTSTGQGQGRMPLYLGLPSAIIFTVALIAIIVVIKRKRERKRNDFQNRTREQEGLMEIPKKKVNKAKKKRFEQKLKSCYKKLYKVNKVPFIPEEIYCVNDFFVPRPLEFSQPSSCQESSIQLQSHHEIFHEKHSKCLKLINMKGDHGYGKSTLALQMAYEWCEERSSTYMNNYEIFILLNMKEINSLKCLNQAINSILPQDTRFDVGDIKSIVESYSSGLVVLDDFNGFDDEDKEDASDFKKIVRGEILPNFHVLVIPTPEFNSNDIDCNASKIFLKNLDEQYQDEYIDKNVSSSILDFKEKMRKIFEDNPLLAEFCEIPLFFSLYMHISTREKRLVSSLTDLFSKIMTLFSKDTCPKGMEAIKVDVDKKLSKIAFESLENPYDRKQWEAKQLSRDLGKEEFTYYKDIGLLVTERQFSGQERIKFRHKLLLEWYAILHPNIKDTIAETTYSNISKYAVCVACALYSNSNGEFIPKILETQGATKGFSMIYLDLFKAGLLATECTANLYETSTVSFSAGDTQREQYSAIVTLNLTAKNGGKIYKIKVSCCLKLPVRTQKCLTLESGVRIPPFETLENLELDLRNQKFEDADGHYILDYVASCKMIKVLRFSFWFLGGEFTRHILKKLYTGKVSVEWKSSNENVWALNFSKKRWELQRDGVKVLVPGRYSETDDIFQGNYERKYQR